jgi:hypothetical protein
MRKTLRFTGSVAIRYFYVGIKKLMAVFLLLAINFTVYSQTVSAPFKSAKLNVVSANNIVIDSTTAISTNCVDSLILSAKIVRPVKITFTPFSPPDDIELAVYASDSTTMISHFIKHVTTITDTTLYLSAGKYYLAWLGGGANLKPPVVSGENISIKGWIRMTQYEGLPFTLNKKSIVIEGQALLSANVYYTGNGKLKYKWTPSTGLDNDSIARPTATVNSNTVYAVTVTSPNGCTVTGSVTVPVVALKANAGADKSVVCGGTIQLNSVTTNYTGTGKLRYKWTPSTGLNNDTIVQPTALGTSDITYSITVTTPSGYTATDDVKVTVASLTANAGTDKTAICGGTVRLDTVTTNYTGTGTLKYKWTPSTGLNNDTIANPTATVVSNTTYTVTVSTPNGCSTSVNVSVTIEPMTKPEIGIVGVTTTNKNRIVWNKPVSTGISSYNIYRETTVSDVYEKVGNVPYDSLSVFVDSQSAPDVKSGKYKLSIVDRNGLESALSTSHKTMHLSINKGQNTTWNLIWEPYEGFAVSTYNIYRGTSLNSLNFIDATSGSSTQYSDISAPSGDVYYQMEVISPTLVSPAKVSAPVLKSKESENVTTSTLVSYSSSRSNVATNILNGINELQEEQDINIYPNPAKDEIRIDFEGGSTFEILNLMGQVVYDGNLIKNTIVQTSDFSSGVYLIRFKMGNTFTYKKIIKE